MDYFWPIIIVYVVLNIVVAFTYSYDKFKAKHNWWRVSENTLIFMSLIAPFGALHGMNKAHHKTHKLKFKLVYVFLLAHIILFAYLIYLQIQSM